MKTLHFNDPDFVLMCALDWVIDRQTYAPAMIADEIEKVWDDLSVLTRIYIQNRIKRSYCKCAKLNKILDKI